MQGSAIRLVWLFWLSGPGLLSPVQAPQAFDESEQDEDEGESDQATGDEAQCRVLSTRSTPGPCQVPEAPRISF